ncbi:hypothetical protein N7603_00265 [Acholeplasma vituli]|uniref:Uncharacterized protein n=1 Tax=Paracholeplasma vituli TaxID=69473 RepID=A0ABT2PWR0_9MOLU|nr:hypothetical protein [Paracholeplasma vituli]MCU0104093.1 hypothetical protein [Paracholeplasma vituli]
MKKKIISVVLMGVLMTGYLIHLVSKPVKNTPEIVLEFDEGDPIFKVGG